MIKQLYIFLLSSICLPIVVLAQTDSTVWISGKVIDSDYGSPVPYANIASYSQHLMYAADFSGQFYIQLPYDDSVKIVMLGYEAKVFKLDTVSVNENDISLFFLERASIMLNNVDIKLRRGYFSTEKILDSRGDGFENSDLHLPSDIKMYDKSKDIIPASYKPIFSKRPPLAVFFFHPLSYITYFTSRKERIKRRMVKIIYSEKKGVKLSKEIIEEISGYDGTELQQFIVYCNTNIKIAKNETKTTLRQKVVFALDDYSLSKNSSESNSSIKPQKGN